MTDHRETRRVQRQRDSRKHERRQERHTDNAALRDAVRAIGAGDAEDWPQDIEQPLSGENTEVLE